MFAYCNNNPVNFTDPTGEIAGWIIAAIVAVCLLVLSSCKDKDPIHREVEEQKFDSVDDAVRDFGNKHLDESIKNDKEYAALIYEKNVDGEIYYTYNEILIGQQHGIQPEIPEGKGVVAVVHTHGDFSPGYADEMMSSDDRDYADDNNVSVYLITPSRKIFKYDLSTERTTEIKWEN